MADTRTYSEVGPTGQRAAANIRRLRDARQLTTAELAERVAARGVPMSATTVTKIEKKNRRVTLDELAALATALGVAPAALLLDPDADPVGEVAAFAGAMIRGPFHLEVDADADGVMSWMVGGGRPRRLPDTRADIEAEFLRQRDERDG